MVPTTNDEYKEFVRKEKEEKEAAAAAAEAAAEAETSGHRRKSRGSRDFAADLEFNNGSFQGKSKRSNRDRTSSRDRTGSHDRSPRREGHSPRRESHASSHRRGKKDDGKVPTTNEEYQEMLARERESGLGEYKELANMDRNDQKDTTTFDRPTSRWDADVAATVPANQVAGFSTADPLTDGVEGHYKD